MKKAVELAFNKFDDGFRPEGYKKPKHWYVVGAKGKLYPAKGIWAIANEVNPASFNTKHAIRGLIDLDYSLIDTRDTETEGAFDSDIQRSQHDSSENRAIRLKNAPIKPESYVSITTKYKRNPDVIAEVLLRAGGICEECKEKAPFIKRKDGIPYLEVHHKIQLSEGGDDTIKNAVALCPNCHRKAHYG